MTTGTTVFQSRWGFHRCDYDFFLKLKHLHGWYWQTLYDYHCWYRWWRKEPQNRIGPEPKFCPLFVEDRIWYKPVQIRGERGFKVYPKTVTDHGIVELYQTARMPQPEPVMPFDAETRKLIESLYEKTETWFGE
jgi:hypothetical protein